MKADDPVVAVHAEKIAHLAERYGAAYYGDDPEWPGWLEDLCKATSQLEAEARFRTFLIKKQANHSGAS